MDSLNSFAFSNRGLIMLEKGEHEKSIADLNRAVELNNQVAEFYYNRAKYFSEKKAYDKAISDYSKARELVPEYKAKDISRLIKAAKKAFLSE